MPKSSRIVILAGAFTVGASRLWAAQAPLPPSRPAFSSRPQPPSQAFLQRAIMDDNAEIMLGQMAEKRGPAVNTLGVMLVQDHIQARDRADEIAKTEGMTPPAGLSPASLQERMKLGRLSGSRFNYAFVRFIIKDHKKAIAAYREEGREVGPVAELARSTLPLLEKHLRVAIGLAQQGS